MRSPSSSPDGSREPLPADDDSPAFAQVLQTRLSRRTVLRGSLAAAAGWLGSLPLALSPLGDVRAAPTSLKLNFAAVPKSREDAVRLASGYSWRVLLATGDPLTSSTPPYANDGSDAAASFQQRAGDHHDGMHYFGMNRAGRWDARSAERGLLCINHEAITGAFLHPTGQTLADGRRTAGQEVLKEMLAHGVSVVEVRRDGASYRIDKASPFNRRITSLTEALITGPAAGHPLMVTRYSPEGTRTRGTLANCANGHTPWGTYLTCEENWAGYFRRLPEDDARRSAKALVALKRYGIAGKGKELWATVTPDTPDQQFGRWQAAVTGSSADGSDDYRHAANTFGWVVEIDPFAPDTLPRKRTALGRFAHEGAWPARVIPGQPLVWYMGCDSRNEYIYKYVSKAPWDPADATRGLAAGDKYLNDGTLYVARFHADGSGEWRELRLGAHGIDAQHPVYGFSDQGDVLIHARLAADAAGGTRMDRPEWAAVHPHHGEVYMTLTYNPSRKVSEVDAANPRSYNDPKDGVAQKGNANGHIIRWAEDGARADATRFRWDVFLFAARAGADPQNVNLSGLTADNDFSSPDGLWFSHSGLLWIETDDHAYRDQSNCMLLAAIPGRVGDGERKTVLNREGEDERSVSTPVGASASDATLRRFLVGPVDCEITGVAESPDGRALFINIQHPGETTSGKQFDLRDPTTWLSHWPGGGSARPRSATIVITRDNGGPVGADAIAT